MAVKRYYQDVLSSGLSARKIENHINVDSPPVVINPGTNVRTLPDAEKLNNLTSYRDPTPEDDYYYGYREGSKWINTESGEIFVCLESDIAKTIWKSIFSYAQVVAMSPETTLGRNSDGFLSLTMPAPIGRVLYLYVKDTVKVLGGWVISGSQILLPDVLPFREGLPVTAYYSGKDLGLIQ